MKRTLQYLGAAGAIAFLLFSSCAKNYSVSLPLEADSSTTTVMDNGFALSASTDAITTSFIDFNANASKFLALDSLANMQADSLQADLMQTDSLTTDSSAVVTDTLISTFPSGSVSNGISRSGTIISVLSGSLQAHTFADNITFSNYTYTGLQIKGQIQLTQLTDSTFSNVITGAEVIDPVTNNIATFSAADTVFIHYDSVAVSFNQAIIKLLNGTLAGTNAIGVRYTAKIMSPIIYSAICQMQAGPAPVSGRLTITSNTYKTARVVDYGPGSCDENYTVTIGTEVFNETYSVLPGTGTK